VGDTRNAYVVLVGNLTTKTTGSIDLDCSVILKWTLTIIRSRILDQSCLGKGPAADTWELGNELSGSIEGGKFLD
jgi:hypothetical protein